MEIKKCEHEARSWVKDLQPGRAFKRPPTHLGVGDGDGDGAWMELDAEHPRRLRSVK